MSFRVRIFYLGLHLTTAILLVIAGKWIFPVCHYAGMDIPVAGGGTAPMKCLYTHYFTTVTGALIAMVAAIKFALPDEISPFIFLFMLYLTAITLTWAIPGVCAGPGMPCRSRTLPLWTVISISGMVFTFVEFIFSRETARK